MKWFESDGRKNLLCSNRNRESRFLQVTRRLQIDRLLPIQHCLIPIDKIPHRAAPHRRVRKRPIQAAMPPIICVYDDRNSSTGEGNIKRHADPGENLDAAETEREDQGEEAPEGRGGADAEHGFPFTVDGEVVMAEFVDKVGVDGEDEDGGYEGEAVEDGGGETEEKAAEAHCEMCGGCCGTRLMLFGCELAFLGLGLTAEIC